MLYIYILCIQHIVRERAFASRCSRALFLIVIDSSSRFSFDRTSNTSNKGSYWRSKLPRADTQSERILSIYCTCCFRIAIAGTQLCFLTERERMRPPLIIIIIIIYIYNYICVRSHISYIFCKFKKVRTTSERIRSKKVTERARYKGKLIIIIYRWRTRRVKNGRNSTFYD